jgi:hypothetical protein
MTSSTSVMMIMIIQKRTLTTCMGSFLRLQFAFFFSDLRNTFLDVMVDTRRLILIENQVVVSVITDLV